MFRLENKLALWEQNQLISQKQTKQIIEFEKNNKKPHLFFAVLSLGIFVISLGIISLIAANWDGISSTTKLVIDFAILIAIAGGFYIAQEKGKTFWVESSIFALFLMIGASIGLISQIFQTNGDFTNAALAWALFTLPLLLVSHKKLLPLFWVPLFLIGIFFREIIWIYIEPLVRWFMEHISEEPTILTALFIAFYALLAVGFNYINRKLRGNYPVFAILRGYCEFFVYYTALFLPIYGYVFGYAGEFSIWQTFLSVTTVSVAAWIYYHNNNPRMLNLNIVFIGLSFLISYFRLFEDLLTTGLGLIISGIVILVLVFGIKIVMQKTAKLKGYK